MSSEQYTIERFLTDPSEESFHDLFRAMAPRMICYFRARGCDFELSEDLTQEVMLAVYKGSRMVRNRDVFRSWLYTVAKNVLARHLRDRNRRVTTVVLDAEAHQWSAPEMDPLLRSQFAEWIAYLDPDERQIMLLRYVDELEHHEIAAVLEMPLGTVQWRIFQARRKLANRFGAGAS